MSWALVAAAATGLNAGSGLHCLLVECYPGTGTGTAQDLADSYWQLFRSTTNAKLRLSSTLGTIGSLASLGAYFTGEVGDPAWITCAIVSAIVPLYNLLVLNPTASVVNNPVMDAQLPKERDSWLVSFKRKSMVTAGFALTAFACTLLTAGIVEDGVADGFRFRP